ncbi:MAG: hypothetical protein NTU47_13205 [Ignavibacteriales bacterium]|nr:hypothetical protein [Ignavibacteriales bacterium]
MRSIIHAVLLLFLFLPSLSRGQTNPRFDVTLRVDYSSTDEMLDFFERRSGNAGRVAAQKGNQIAAATSRLLARTVRPVDDFERALELARDTYNSPDDVYGLKTAVTRLSELKKLLAETKRRRLDRRVVATISSLFPADANVSVSIPVFVVAMGNEKAAAFVRRVVWKENVPVFVGGDQGEQVIVLNLSRCLMRGTGVEQEFIQVLSILAHECFHAVYGAYRSGDLDANSPVAALANLVHNEGIAYFLSMEIRDGGEDPPPQWFDVTARAVEKLNGAMLELQSPGVTPGRTRDLIMNSNLSGSFEGNYGATAGLRIAYEIEKRLGRPALTETVRKGAGDFFEKYSELCRRDNDLPKLDKEALRVFGR